MHRKAATQDHKLVYWFAGWLAALSVLLEKKGRRGELGLYVLPRASESLWYILVNRRVLPDIKNAEVLLLEFLLTCDFKNCLCEYLKSIFLILN